MDSVDGSFKTDAQPRTLWRQICDWGDENLNFFKLHMLAFTLVPLICAAILYACNGRYPIRFVDALFICVSAATSTGLMTADLSALTAWQQIIIAALTIAGSPTTVAWIVVLVRKHYFTTHLNNIVEQELAKAPPTPSIMTTLREKGKDVVRGSKIFASRTLSQHSEAAELQPRAVRPVEIRIITASRQNSATHLGDSNGHGGAVDRGQMAGTPKPRSPLTPHEDYRSHRQNLPVVRPNYLHINGEYTGPTRSPTLLSPSSLQPVEGAQASRISLRFSEDVDQELRRRILDLRLRQKTIRQQTAKLHVAAGLPPPTAARKERGGFGNPFRLVDSMLKRASPSFRKAVRRKLTMPAHETLSGAADRPLDPERASGHLAPTAGDEKGEERMVPYLSPGHQLHVRMGSTLSLESLSDDDYAELGGAEYQALKALVWIVPGFFFATLTLGFMVIAPYTTLSRWSPTFLPPNQHRPINTAWYSVFILIAAWCNTGMSLVDQNLVPFQRAYPLLVILIIVAILGDTGFPVGLRFTIWAFSCITREGGRTHAALKFLLDHPRRCFILLFPSRQTWFLLTVIIALNVADWAAFLILDIGIPEIEAIPTGVRVMLGVLQAVAVRLAGFTAFSIATVAPAMKILYLIMMFIAAYPITMSVRATNVYEEKSLGIFKEEEEEDKLINDIENDAAYPESDGRVAIWGRYLGRHVRHQLSHDLWWLMLALLVLTVVERGNIRDPKSDSWFNLFSLVFETVSAYTTVGLSLGIPTANYSLSGAFSPLSKVIMCAIMLRGRHRGLPLKVDRSIMLPREFEQGKREHFKRLRASRVELEDDMLGIAMTGSVSGPVAGTQMSRAVSEQERLETVKESLDEKCDACGADDTSGGLKEARGVEEKAE
ncbi:TrkH-domain-containing protein [Peniophora sp. CONT]|nr:TrkH-domain-containing protein [Peniophora sp. CONT]